jgi:hypothetical protein
MLSSFDSLLSAHLDFMSKLMSTFLVSVGVCVALSVLYESVYHHLNKRPRHEIYDEIFISCNATPLSPAWFNDQRVVAITPSIWCLTRLWAMTATWASSKSGAILRKTGTRFW